MEILKQIWEKIKFVWNKVVGFKGTKYIVVLGITAIVFAIVIVNSNAVFILEGTSTQQEKVVFLAFENTDNCYHGAQLAKDKSDDYCELWYIVEGYTSRQSFEKGEAAVYNSETSKETFYDGTSKVVPYHFSNENITSNRAMGVEHRITTVVRRITETKTRDDGSTYERKTSYRPTVWYQVDKSNISKLESYTFGTFIELTKYKNDYNASYFRLTYKVDDDASHNRYFRDFEI
ncbi:MAG: hypothetical protein IJU60_04970 [Acholeplasmatales bacterium]|nr:hypothetical protein [Acholeplasmatales bacterium]